MKNRCVIIGGANIENYEPIRSILQDDDFFIFCDSGLSHLDYLGVKPNLIVGDFDSYLNPHMDVETIVLPCEKDDTDTVFAVKEAAKRGFTEFLLVGVLGKRIDHSLGNISILYHLDALGLRGVIVDDYSHIELVSREPVYVEDRYPFFSLLNLSGSAEGITVENAKYSLENGKISCEYQYGVSNEVLPGKMAKISVRNGKLLLVKVLKN